VPDLGTLTYIVFRYVAHWQPRRHQRCLRIRRQRDPDRGHADRRVASRKARSLARPRPLNCATASALAGDEDEARRVEGKAQSIGIQGNRWYQGWLEQP
jgi:hypothetical protein